MSIPQRDLSSPCKLVTGILHIFDVDRSHVANRTSPHCGTVQWH